MTVMVGQIVTVINDIGDGWVYAALPTGQKGYIPGDFLDYI
jgi:hypothetical protein